MNNQQLQELDALPAPPAWYYPQTDEAWALPREYQMLKNQSFDAEAQAAAVQATTLRLLKQFYAQELLDAGSEEALRTKKEAYRVERKQHQEKVMASILSNSIKVKFFAPTPEEEARREAELDALPDPPDWFFSTYPMSDIRCLWEPWFEEPWEAMNERISRLEARGYKSSYLRELKEAGSLENLRQQKVGILQRGLEWQLLKFCRKDSRMNPQLA